ncbi:acylneuraminate cytidylyltransferase family protein [Leptospira kanakyensis]|uniref:acylneuraminate cytidylyltransferase family protein n=1 Tax=Leptospira kanakyensis TaxID=2484968 RepID=UPI00223CA74C|nr:acylneuraminate cytidylyltransferase family protein [Leptospira kanakyensis]MCW7471411.1 acylneuraminate cytidylyltransferase family protein [Leptospira kanakyensis]
MINGKKVLGLIPARGGSKGLPGKNIKMLCGKPLIVWSIEKAKKSKYIDDLIVNTDSLEIADISKKNGADVPFIRPSELATDSASTFSVLEHTLNFYKNKNVFYDYLILLEPTSPLREDDDIDKMLLMLEEENENFDSIVSLGKVNEHPSIMKHFFEKKIFPFCPELVQTTRRQDNKPAYFPYGVAYIVKTNNLLIEKTFYTDRCTGYEIKRYQNYEIDDIYDFLCVEAVMRKEWNII